MINFYNQVPSVYNSASRDFQYLSWLINVVLNSVKHNVDDLYNLPNNQADPRLTELLALTLGFKVKRNYNQKQLIALVSVIPSILKYKGTEKAVGLACRALIRASGAKGSFNIKLENNCLEVQLPEMLVDTNLFMDLLPYILPAGLSVRIVAKNIYKSDVENIDLDYDDVPIADWLPDLDWNSTSGTSIGLSTLFEDSTYGEIKPEFANFKSSGDKVFNAGLLDNSIIPAVTKMLQDNKTSHLIERQKEED